MGYRSQVECCIYGDPKDCATFLLKEADKIHACMEDWKEWATTASAMELHPTDNNVLITLSLDGVKWYDSYEDIHSYEDIQRWDMLLKAIDAESYKDEPAYNMNYEFIRVGEVSGDVEERCGGASIEHLLCTSTTIVRSY